MARFRHWLMGCAVIALSIALSMALAPASAAPADAATGGLQGRVVAPDGSPLAGIEVSARPESGYSTTVQTDGEGGYAFTDLPPGSYGLTFFDPAGTWVSERYDDAVGFEPGTPVSVVAGSISGPYDATLGTPASISGEVRADGAPEVDSYLYLYARDGNQWRRVRSTSTTYTDATYTFDGLAPGTYRVGVSNPDEPYVDTFHPAADLVENAASITVAHGEDRTGVDVDLLPGGAIAGTVSDEAGAGIGGVKVVVTDVTMETRYFEGTTDADGRYRVGRLTTGDYVVRFGGYDADKQSEYWRDAPTLFTATPVHVTSGQDASGTDAVLTEPSRLSGTVTDRDTGDPIPYARIDLYELRGAYWQPTDTHAWADADGHYELRGVWGTYRLLAYDGAYETHDYAFHPGVHSVEDATTVELPAGEDVVVDFGLTRKPDTSTIAGTVRVGGAPRGGIVVEPELLLDGTWHVMNHVTTAADGTYKAYVADPGTYRVHFKDPSGVLADQWSGGAASAVDATPVTVGPGVDLTGTDADLGGPTPNGAIDGVVTDPDGEPIRDFEVTIHGFNEIEQRWIQVARTRTGSDGRYAVRALPVDTYRVGFVGQGREWIDEFHLDSETVDDATDVPVTEDETARVDATLAPSPGGLLGKVTSDAGAPLDAVRVELWAADPDGDWAVVDDTALEPSGYYRFTGLEHGDYRLGVVDTTGGHADAFWPGVATMDEAFGVTVWAGETSSYNITMHAVAQEETPTPSPSPTTEPTVTPSPSPTSTSTATATPTPTPTPTPAPVPTISQQGTPRLVGTPEVGQVVRVRRTSWSPSNVTLRYQWLADGRKIRRATRARLTLTRALVGARLRVRITASLDGASPVVVRTRPSARVRA